MVLCTVFLLFTGIHLSYAQDEIKGIDRWSFGTNALEWLLTIPNFRVSFDVTPSQYNHHVAMLGVKYNWNTFHNTVPYYVFNVLDIRPEYRRYFRTVKRDPGKPVPWYSLFRNNPRPWRAYYVGAYADYSYYSIKPGQYGWQGWSVGVGLSGGYEIPLYTYKKGAVDLDLGFSLGVLATSNKAYVLGSDGFHYQGAPQQDKPFLILPMLTELRAVFSWRHLSVSNKYKEEDPMDDRVRKARQAIDEDIPGYTVESFWESRNDREKKEFRQSDSLYRARYFKYVDDMVLQRTGIINDDYTLSASAKKKLLSYLNGKGVTLKNGFSRELTKLRSERRKETQKQKKTKKTANKEVAE